MWYITRETKNFIKLRHQYMLSPFNAGRMSSKTVVFTDVPVEYQNKAKLAELFGEAYKWSWLVTDVKELTKLVEERDKVAFKLEGAEIKLAQTAVKNQIKVDKKNKKGKQAPTQTKTGSGDEKTLTQDAGDAEAQVHGSHLVAEKDYPKHRPGKFPMSLFKKKVDTIQWSRTQLEEGNGPLTKALDIHTLQEQKDTLLPAVIVEFTTQQEAQTAFRRMSPRKEPKMNPRGIDATPEEIVWENLKIKAPMRRIRKIAAQTFITLMIIFWSIPVAIVGAISNINYLTDSKLPHNP